MKQPWNGAARRRAPYCREMYALTILSGLVSNAWAQDTAAAAGNQPTVAPTVTVTGFRSSLALSANEKRENNGLTDTVFSEDIGKFPDPNIADALSRVPGVTVTRASIDGEGMNISIRGMGPAFTRVLLNGAPMASASAGSWGGNISANREVDMDFLPSELFRSATVYKSQQADIIEGGVAGTVNMRSVRPFDKSGFRSAFTASGNYRDKDGKWGNTGSGLVSNTWNTRFGKVGALAGFAWGNTKYHTDVFQTVDMRTFRLNANQRNASDPAALPGDYFNSPATVPSGVPMSALPAYAQSVLTPGAPIDRAMLLALNPGATIQQIDNGLMGRLPRYLVYSGERRRRGEVLSFQWQPNDQWDVYLDTLFAQKGNKMTQEDMNVGMRANTPIPIGMEFDRSDCSAYCTITNATLANTFWSLEFRPMKENTHFRSINPGFEYRPTEKLTIDGHVNYTDSEFYRDMPTVLVATTSPSSVVKYSNTNPGQIPVMTSNIDVNDPSAFGWYQAGQGLSGLRTDLYQRRNTTKGSRLNLNWGDDAFAIKVGGAFDDIERRYTDYNNADAWMNLTCGNNVNYPFMAPNTALQGTCDGRFQPGPVASTVYPGYGTGATAGATNQLVYLGSAVTNADLAKYVHASDHGFITVDWDKFAKDTNYQYFRDHIADVPTTGGGYLREKVKAFYVETNGKVPVFGRTFRYNAGVRYAQTEQTIGAPQSVADPRNAAQSLANGGRYLNQQAWAYESTKYHNILPSFTVSYNVLHDLIARVSGSKSLTRANPADLHQTQLFIGDQGVNQGQVSNPNLKPFKANNLDLSLEWYFSREGYVALSGFAKDIVSRPGTRYIDYTLAQLDQIYGTVGLTAAQQAAVDAAGGRDQKHVIISEPYNIDTKLKVRGLEFTWQQPLDMLPVKGFGFTGNYTYTKQTDEVVGAPPVAGVPPRTNNLTVYYERNGVNLRVSRQYTASLISNTGTGLGAGVYAYSTSRSQVDMSAGLNLQKVFGFRHNTDLTLSVWNVNNAKSQNYTQFTNAIFDENAPGRSYTMSLRTSF
ncbi:TonB-dependent receptor [Massilia rhizosphaerae]|uniref:TonB-dependent receptor n=1 Tax=Massilia rhizosphaerae TaxID=2784389 RepID=UPI0018DC3F8A|nr:TonB-dependent receptor [Massilia rhizosphaerae]